MRRDAMRDRLLGMQDEPLAMPRDLFPMYAPARRDRRRWRAYCRGKGTFVQLVVGMTLGFPDGSREEVWGDVSRPLWIPWADPGALWRTDWDQVRDSMVDDGIELREIGAKAAASQVGGPAPVELDGDLQRLLLVHRLIGALRYRGLS